jgi:hypothetical protein
VIQWYPAYRKMMVYNINRADSPPRNPARPMGTYRHTPYRFQQFVYALRMRGRDTLYGRYADILAPWKDLPHRKLWYRLPAKDPSTFGTEIRLSVEDGARFVRELQAVQRGTDLLFGKRDGLGLRFSYRTTSEGARHGYVWMEWVSRDLGDLNRFVDIAERVAAGGVAFHQGKYVPARDDRIPR